MKHIDIAAAGTCYVDLNAGSYPFGAEGIPTETELVGGSYEIVAGGSAVNFCRFISTLGLTAAFIGMAGKDAMGDVLTKLLEENGIAPFVARRDDLTTNVGFNMTNPAGEHIMCVAGTANKALSLATIRPELENAARTAPIIYLGGCLKLRGLQPDFAEVATICKGGGATLVVDHGRVPGNVAPGALDTVRNLVLGADYYLPSRNEFCTLWGVDSVEDGLAIMTEKAPQLRTVVKDGEYYAKDGHMQHVPAERISAPYEVTGAGDAFNAGVIRAIVDGRSLGEAAAFGCSVAGAKLIGDEIPALA
jgi:ribokinase